MPDEHRRELAEGLGSACYCLNEYRESGDAFVRAARSGEEPQPRALNLARKAARKKDLVVVTGSFIVAGEALAHLT